MASASSEHEVGEKPAKKPWRRPTFYILTDIIESSGNPSYHKTLRTNPVEDETIPTATPGSSRYKSYVPISA